MSDDSPGEPPVPPALARTAPRGARTHRTDPDGKRALFGASADRPVAAVPDDAGARRPFAAPAPTATESAPASVDAPSREVVPWPRPDPTAARDSDPSADDDRRSDVDHWGRSERLRAMTRALYDPMYRHWFRVEWEGFEHIPSEGGALLVSNHAGAIPSDAPAIMHGIETRLQRPVYGLAEHLFKALPVVGTLWSRVGGVAAHPDNAYRLLHDERQLALVFPEGTKGTGKHYSKRYQLARFGRGGFVEIAMRSGVPVIPIAVVGAEESMPILWQSRRLAKILNIPYFPVTANMLAFGPAGIGVYLPAKFRIRVLPPVRFDIAPNQERYSRARVMEETEGIRTRIQGALYDMLRDRRSVWFG